MNTSLMNNRMPLSQRKGFALVVTLMMMVLLTLVAIGLLSLGTVTLRASSAGESRRVAEANARLSMVLALGELQKNLGDDRRVTANASILDTGTDTSPSSRMVGVWDSAASGLSEGDASKAGPDYATWKKSLFRSWLVSSPDPEAVKSREFASQSPDPNAMLLYHEKTDGFDLRASVVPVVNTGGMAWAVTQEADKARINIQGNQIRKNPNDVLQAPSRPNLTSSGFAKHPTGDWDARSARVVSLNQAVLDPGYAIDKASRNKLGPDYTTVSRGVLANVVKGGLKTDMSLGFEMEESDFLRSDWGTVANPFREGAKEKPLYKAVNGGEPVSATFAYGAVNHTQEFPVGAPPTFQTLRSYYRTYRHLYDSKGTATAFFRPQSSSYWTRMPGMAAPRGSESSISPVLDRVLYFLSLWVDAKGVPNIVITPVITLWNPYNIAIESEGFVVYPWMDLPLWVDLKADKRTGGSEGKSIWFSQLAGNGRSAATEGRQKDPYFFCNLTAKGDGTTTTPLRLEPGEVRVFCPKDPTPRLFDRKAADEARTWNLRPVESLDDLELTGGVALRTSDTMKPEDAFTYKVMPADRLNATFVFARSAYHYFVTMEDAGRMTRKAPRVLNEVQLYKGKEPADPRIDNVGFPAAEIMTEPKAVGVLETYHRTAGQAGQLSDLVYTVNTRQRYVNTILSGSQFAAGPHYDSSMRKVADVVGAGLQVSLDAQRSYYGSSNGAATGRDYLSFFEVPREPSISLGTFQNLDLADTAFAPSSQFGNSWASPYVDRAKVARNLVTATTGERIMPVGIGIYDHAYLLNEALWDGYYFSSFAPRTSRKSEAGSASVYDSSQVNETRSLSAVITDWLKSPETAPLRNPRYSLHRGGLSDDKLKDLLLSPAGCREVSGHLLVDGMFNVNSTSESAWRAILSSLRGEEFQTVLPSGALASVNSGKDTPVTRFGMPTGSADDSWNGFRQLSDDEIKVLAKEIVTEVKARGPFQSVGEFVNRRVNSSDLGLKGALQAAIDRAGLNKSVGDMKKFVTASYPYQMNLPEPYTETGTPGWLTQADLLNALAPIITVRSDTFTIRGYGEARDKNGAVTGRAWCEAVVQRVPEWMEPGDAAVELPATLTPANAKFGRRFEIVSFRMRSQQESGI